MGAATGGNEEREMNKEFAMLGINPDTKEIVGICEISDKTAINEFIDDGLLLMTCKTQLAKTWFGQKVPDILDKLLFQKEEEK
jgi:hypothetical protein